MVIVFLFPVCCFVSVVLHYSWREYFSCFYSGDVGHTCCCFRSWSKQICSRHLGARFFQRKSFVGFSMKSDSLPSLTACTFKTQSNTHYYSFPFSGTYDVVSSIMWVYEYILFSHYLKTCQDCQHSPFSWCYTYVTWTSHCLKLTLFWTIYSGWEQRKNRVPLYWPSVKIIHQITAHRFSSQKGPVMQKKHFCVM